MLLRSERQCFSSRLCRRRVSIDIPYTSLGILAVRFILDLVAFTHLQFHQNLFVACRFSPLFASTSAAFISEGQFSFSSIWSFIYQWQKSEYKRQSFLPSKAPLLGDTGAVLRDFEVAEVCRF